MDYFKCEKCGKVFDEFEMNFKAAQEDKRCWCRECREKEERVTDPLGYAAKFGPGHRLD